MDQISSYLEVLKSNPNTPKFVDFQVLAERTREAEGEKYQLVLKLMDPKTRAHICTAVIYPMEWFP